LFDAVNLTPFPDRNPVLPLFDWPIWQTSIEYLNPSIPSIKYRFTQPVSASVHAFFTRRSFAHFAFLGMADALLHLVDVCRL